MADNPTFTAKGIVKSVRKDRKGVQLEDENWYSQFSEVDCNKGDLVTIDYKINGHFKNISKLIILERMLPTLPQEIKTNEKAITMLVAYVKDIVVAKLQHATTTLNLAPDMTAEWITANEQIWKSYNFFKEKLNA